MASDSALGTRLGTSSDLTSSVVIAQVSLGHSTLAMGHGGRDAIVLAISNNERIEGTGSSILRATLGIGDSIGSGSDTSGRTILILTSIQSHGVLRSDSSTNLIVAHLSTSHSNRGRRNGRILLGSKQHIEDFLDILTSGAQSQRTRGRNSLNTDISSQGQILAKVNVLSVIVAISSAPGRTIIHIGSVRSLVIGDNTLDNSDVTFLGSRSNSANSNQVSLFSFSSHSKIVVLILGDKSLDISRITSKVVQVNPVGGTITNLHQTGITLNANLTGKQHGIVSGPVLSGIIALLDSGSDSFLSHLKCPPFKKINSLQKYRH